MSDLKANDLEAAWSDLEVFIKRATKEQRELLFKLSDLHEQEEKLVMQINNIKASTKVGVYSPDGESLTVCEDDDDALVISFGPRKELADIREQTKRLMVQAVKLGMEKLGIIQHHYEEYVGQPLHQ